MKTRQLPEPFVALEPFVNAWALPHEQARYQRLHTVTIDELRVFYDAMLPCMDEILPFLNGYSMNDMPADVRMLFDLTMTFSETAHPIDLKWKDVDFTLAYPWEKFEFRTISAGV